MSHLAVQTVKAGEPVFTDINALRRAAEQLGLEMVEQSTFRWYGEYVGDSPMPAGVTKEMMGKNATYVIRFPEAAVAKMREDSRYFTPPYEIGVIADPNNAGSYLITYDYFCGGYGLDKVVGEPIMRDGAPEVLAPKLLQRYAMVCDAAAAQEAGDSIEFLTTKQANEKYPDTFTQPGDEDTFVSIVNTDSRVPAAGAY